MGNKRARHGAKGVTYDEYWERRYSKQAYNRFWRSAGIGAGTAAITGDIPTGLRAFGTAETLGRFYDGYRNWGHQMPVC